MLFDYVDIIYPKKICDDCNMDYNKNHCCKCKMNYYYNHCCDCKKNYYKNHCCKCNVEFNYNHCCDCGTNYNDNHCCKCKMKYRDRHCCNCRADIDYDEFHCCKCGMCFGGMISIYRHCKCGKSVTNECKKYNGCFNRECVDCPCQCKCLFKCEKCGDIAHISKPEYYISDPYECKKCGGKFHTCEKEHCIDCIKTSKCIYECKNCYGCINKYCKCTNRCDCITIYNIYNKAINKYKIKKTNIKKIEI